MLLPLDSEGWETPTWEHFLQLAIEEEERGEVEPTDVPEDADSYRPRGAAAGRGSDGLGAEHLE